MVPNGFDIPFPPYRIYFYGIAIMVGIIAAAVLASFQVRRKGHDPEIVADALIWLIIGGLIGARLWHVFTPSPTSIAAGRTTLYYLTHPLDLINIRSGGLGIPGAVIGGAIALYIFSRRRKLNFAYWVDIAAPSLALAQAIGRWGNFFNQELYGSPTDLPWKIFIAPENRLPGFTDQAYFHPLFLYESLWNFGNLLILLWLGRRFSDKLKPGDIFITYLIIYPVGRFLLDFLRLDASMIGGINANQTAMVIVAIIAGAVLYLRHRPKGLALSG